MNLTKAEYNQFNLRSRLQLLQKDAVLLGYSGFGKQFTGELYKIYDFYVELLFDRLEDTPVRADPIPSLQWLRLYDIHPDEFEPP